MRTTISRWSTIWTPNPAIQDADETIYQALIEAELTAVIGAEPHQRTKARLPTSRTSHTMRGVA